MTYLLMASAIAAALVAGIFYRVRWTRWNHVRTAASLAAAGSFVLAISAG